ncbi:NnrU family protein [Oceanibium sediminis]|uniref:NnrU family protein n=1 Tax=Oceanibium sediminis TaxID=2026339 RepID=UPI000DD32EEA|nr:NnrU family protein [Oceanibium sediminis]
MTMLILGVFLWWDAHLFKRAMPGVRAGMTRTMGPASKGVFAALILGSVVLMVLGYRSAAFEPIWWPPAYMVHVNNLLMLLSVIFFGMGSSKGRARSWFRHPMQIGFLLWCIAHLLVNGGLASIVLWGGLALWVPVSITLINRAEGAWTPPAPGPAKGDVRLLIISVVVYLVIGGLHALLGPWPFPS